MWQVTYGEIHAITVAAFCLPCGCVTDEDDRDVGIFRGLYGGAVEVCLDVFLQSKAEVESDKGFAKMFRSFAASESAVASILIW